MATDPRAYKKHVLELRGRPVTLVNSEFFAAALKKEWQEGQKRQVPLPADRPKVVDLYVHWLYTGKIFVRPLLEETGENNTESAIIVELFLFGEKVQDGNLKDAAIDALIMATNTQDKDQKLWYPTNTIEDAYNGTPASSPLRRLLVDMYISHGHGPWIKGTEPIEFLVDLSRALIDSRRDKPNPRSDQLKANRV
ncbi:hypothetical protein M409DRAFT_31115 [Zasmidium cellare ATCC 36951]|uniref:BTB domain-containing protein n=1 Tax=Zasmidium cellare ATCC 36951 TaxID=1080233 RepID=A0A6A6BUC2_ZASCE|nr:uncharacterized protein M409DRAFT_31115 [Zasmidium cellare ATCC 36951]KAF2158361.1 hypothetical protein M409DRAFT_31115 [Zasmidium cellare ATCC 36951]